MPFPKNFCLADSSKSEYTSFSSKYKIEKYRKTGSRVV